MNKQKCQFQIFQLFQNSWPFNFIVVNYIQIQVQIELHYFALIYRYSSHCKDYCKFKVSFRFVCFPCISVQYAEYDKWHCTAHLITTVLSEYIIVKNLL